MKCRKEWDRKILATIFTSTFVNTTYKNFREQLLWEKEKALLPATQPIVESIIKSENDRKQIQVLLQEINKIEKAIGDLQMEIDIRRNKIQEYGNVSRVCEKRSNVLFIRSCPTDNCRGFLNTQWKCGICEQWTCPQCHETKGPFRENPDHICKEENIATACLLQKDTKYCPTCATPIFKIEGCDQMFCTQCQTSFSWRTGRIETGTIHNPHYFEYMRKYGRGVDRNPNDIQCGRELDHNLVISLEDTFHVYMIHGDELPYMGQNILHLQRIELPRFMDRGMQINEDLRIAYLRNYISEEQFKKQLQRKEKDMQKKHEIYNILHMFITCITDIFYRILESNSRTNILLCLEEIHALRAYANESMLIVSNVFKCRKFALSSNLVLCNPDYAHVLM
jgi:hypothetical protein